MYIETQRMIIRDYTIGDVQDLYDILGDAEVMKNCEPAYSFEKTFDFLADFCIQKRGAIAVTHRDSRKMIGYILFHAFDENVYEIGWFFNKGFWRQGYAYEACTAVIDYAFNELNAHKLFAETIDGVKSVGLMKKIGMRLEGVQRSHTKDNDGNWADLYFYGLFKEDWKSMTSDRSRGQAGVNSEYDNEKFFEEYAKMPRSKNGLDAAGEWHQLRRLFPVLQGKRVLDLGCGYGWHCRFSIEKGAERVLGIDLSRKMIEEARGRNMDSKIEYRVCGIEEYEYPDNMWDCVISNLALHYIENIEQVFQNVHRTLRSNGVFIFNIEHPTFTAGVGQDWIYTEDGKPQYWPVDDYFRPGERKTHFLGCDVVKQHHTLTQILMGLLNSGFVLDVVEEAEPSKEMMDIPGMEDELRRPMMLLVKAIARK